MYENARMFFVALWLVATGCLVATGFAALVTWGDYLEFFYASIAAWCIATAGTIITST